MPETKFLPLIHYIVGLAVTVELQGPDKQFVEILGSYESLEDAKTAVENHAVLIMDNDKQCLTIFKVDLNAGRVYDFYRKDLKKAVSLALKFQKEQDKERLNNEREPEPKEGAIHVFKSPKDKGTFPRPSYSASSTETTVSSPLNPISLNRVPSKLK